MRDSGSVAARALRELEISQDTVRERVIEIIGRGKQAPSGHIPFTPRAKKVLELSLREALQLNHSYIGTEHILLGLVGEGEGVAAQVLTKLGGSLSRVRDKVIELAPAGTGEGPELSSQLRRAGPRGPLDTFLRRLEAIEERLAAIERHLGLPGEDAPPGSGAGPGGEHEPGGEQEPGGGAEPGGEQAGGAGR
jgi:ATP-dependent Clp protease ATP-binding subunit ClpC